MMTLMHFTLTVLGSGTMMPTKDRFPSAYLVECDDTRVLVDCGHMAMARLIERGINLHDIDAVVLTHFHADHLSHLLPFIFARFVDAKERGLTAQNLRIIGPKSLTERYRTLRSVMWPEPHEPAITITEVETEAQKIGPVTFTPFSVIHSPLFPCLGYRIEAEGKTLVYSGDMGCEQEKGFEENLKNADVLLIEAGSDTGSKSHCTPESAIAFGKNAGAKRILLTHISAHRLPLIQKAVDAADVNVSIATDGLVIDV